MNSLIKTDRASLCLDSFAEHQVDITKSVIRIVFDEVYLKRKRLFQHGQRVHQSAFNVFCEKATLNQRLRRARMD